MGVTFYGIRADYIAAQREEIPITSSMSTDTLTGILGAIKDLADTVRCQSESNREFLKQIRSGNQNGEGSDTNAKKTPVNPNYHRLSEFKKNTPSSFHGEYDPVVA
ncbi:hypothetical protein PIB30_052443 [Stylosanthes scabra]|uniref:Uncharacterized protein n=1 Tax=Stylosanthes scabra TaxID=79078 RepID=A0ABU6WKX9_9FABA|nr:hypothetical protein [Stylosanthes scabra]